MRWATLLEKILEHLEKCKHVSIGNFAGVLAMFAAGIMSSGCVVSDYGRQIVTSEIVHDGIISAGTITIEKYKLRSVDKKIDYPPTSFFVAPSDSATHFVIYVQGSGCEPLFIRQGGKVFSTQYGFSKFAKNPDFSIMIIEKPFANEERRPDAGTAKGCSTDFNEYFDRQNWMAVIQEAINTYIAEHPSKYTDISIMGFSEGAVVAAGLSKAIDNVTNLVLVSPAGVPQFLDQVILPYTVDSESEKPTSKIVEEAYEFVRGVGVPSETECGSGTAERFPRGHSCRRWQSFGDLNIIDDISMSARVFIINAMEDASVSPVGVEILNYELLRRCHQQVHITRVDGVGHALVFPNADKIEPLASIMADIEQRLSQVDITFQEPVCNK